jgi:hypothetical protein
MKSDFDGSQSREQLALPEKMSGMSIELNYN